MIIKLLLTLIFFPLAIFATQGLKNVHVDLDWLKRDHGPQPDEVFLEAWRTIQAQGEILGANLREPNKPSLTLSAITTEEVIDMVITRNKASGWGPTLDYVLRRGDFLPPLRVIIFTPRVGSISELASVRRAGVQHVTEDEGSSS